MQIESFPPLTPSSPGTRRSPIRDVYLTNADLDHVLGLFLLRELDAPLRIHCTRPVRDTLCRALRLDSLLGAFCGIEWCDLSFTPKSLPGGLTYRALELVGQLPRYADTHSPSAGHSVALEFTNLRSNKKLLVAPDVAALTHELQTALESADVALFDGTFWSEEELQEIDPRARTAREMGHLPIAGGGLVSLRQLRARHRVYIHINNTNPIFLPHSSERLAVEKAGIAIGEDGMEFEL